MTTQGALATTHGVVDADALVAELFAQEGTSLVRLARLFCDDGNSCRSAVVLGPVDLHRSAGSIRDLDRVPAFLRSILINLARDHNRRGLMSLRHRNTAERTTAPAEPDDHAMADEESTAVLVALGSLPDRQRACLVLHYYEELSIAEVAETLEISKNSVKTHCRRGLRSLESRLEEPE